MLCDIGNISSILVLLFLTKSGTAFHHHHHSTSLSRKITSLRESTLPNEENDKQQQAQSRRSFLTTSTLASSLVLLQNPTPSQATIYLDPAMYGDQELRVSAVDTLREAVRRAILQKPGLAPSFYQLSIIDALSYTAKSGDGGPDGTAVKAVLSSSSSSEGGVYIENLKEVCLTLIQATKNLKKLSQITLADAVALGGAEAINSVGGPILPVQLGRMDPNPIKVGKKEGGGTGVQGGKVEDVPLFLLDGLTYGPSEVRKTFLKAGMTEREMTALLGALLTIQKVEEESTPEDWRKSAKPKFREPGKLGRMSEFKRLTDEDIAMMEEQDYDDEEESLIEGDEKIYIAESFGTRDEVFGRKVSAASSSDKTKLQFNRFLAKLNKGKNAKKEFGWIGDVLTDQNSPSSLQWLNKYGSSTLAYEKDLKVAYNSITQLGASYTGGKYESLLKNKPRKTLNDDLDGLFD